MAVLACCTAVAFVPNERQLWAAREGDPSALDFSGFSDGESVRKLDSKIPDCAIHLRVAQQQLDCPEVASLLVNRRLLRALQ